MVNFAKINLFNRGWIDTVFQGRNKEYGAYDLRRRESRITIWATVIGVVGFSLLMSAPVLIKKIGAAAGDGRRTIDQTVTVVDLLPPPDAPKDEFVPPPPPKEMQSIKEVKKFTPPVVAPEDEVVEELVSQDVLKDADAGARNVDASADGEVVIDETPVEHKVERAIIEDNTVHNIKAVQVQPEYPGGLKAFVQFVIDNMGNISVESTDNIRMQFSFVIEKNGTLTDIKVLNDGGHPDIAKLATNVLSWSPKWQPGIINGKPVRVAYILPMVIVPQ